MRLIPTEPIKIFKSEKIAEYQNKTPKEIAKDVIENYTHYLHYKPKLLKEYKYEIIRSEKGAICSYSMIVRTKKFCRLSKWLIKKILGWELKLC
jgi:hypothetical protein